MQSVTKEIPLGSRCSSMARSADLGSRNPDLWARIDEIVARAPDLSAARRHRIHLLAAHQQRLAGVALDPDLRAAKRDAAMKALAVPYVLARLRKAGDAPLVVMKGPEAAASYPVPATRPFKDLDVMTTDPEGIQATLVAEGFTELEGPDYPPTAYHLRPLVCPGVPLVIELHREPHFFEGLPVPALEDLLPLTIPSATRAPGILGLEPSAHAVLLAVHAWAHGALQRLGPLIDVAAVLADGDRAQADRVAADWGCLRVWRSTISAIDALLGDRPTSLALRTWARHLADSREPTVFETHVARVAGQACGLPRNRSVRGVASELYKVARPYGDETWTQKLLRSRRAAGHALKPLSEYRPISTRGGEW